MKGLELLVGVTPEVMQMEKRIGDIVTVKCSDAGPGRAKTKRPMPV